MFRSAFLFNMILISLNIWSKMSCLVLLFPEFKLCTELWESVKINIFSSLFLWAHLSVIKVALSSDE